MGCRFHMQQRWFCKIQALGLFGECNSTNSHVETYLKLLFDMQFLNPNEVESFYLMPNDYSIRKLRNYLLETYTSQDLYFHRVFRLVSLMNRAINCCESFLNNNKNNIFFCLIRKNNIQSIRS